MMKNLESARQQETRVRSPSEKDPMEKEMASHYSILAWDILWTEEPSGLQSMGSQKSWTQPSDKQQLHYCARGVIAIIQVK